MPHNQSVEDVQRQLDRAVARIHEDMDLRDEAKNRMIKQVYEEARSKVVQDVQEGKEELEADLRVARRLAFAPPVLEVPVGRVFVAPRVFIRCSRARAPFHKALHKQPRVVFLKAINRRHR